MDTTILEKINFNFKQNNLDELFLNLSENPIGFDNKNFRTILSTVYELVEEEYAQTFESINVPVRNTHFYFFKNEKSFDVFVTPAVSFEFFLKSKGSMFKLKSEYLKLPDIGLKEGYKVPLELIWEYFCGFNEYLELDYTTPSFQLVNLLTQLGNRIIEKLHFIPVIKTNKDFFSINYEIFPQNNEISSIIQEISNINWDPYLQDKFDIEFLLNNYINFQIYKFLHAKASKFVNYKQAIYFIKPLERKQLSGSKNISQAIENWLDEIYIGKYDILPQIEIKNLNNSSFTIELSIYNKVTKESLPLSSLDSEEFLWGYNKVFVNTIINKQLNYIAHHIPILEPILDNSQVNCFSLNEIYKIITQVNYNLQKAGINLIMPKEFNNIIIPRASINAKIKDKREEDIINLLSNANSGNIKLTEILNFNYQISIGDEKLSLEEFKKLTENKHGLIEYKGLYVLIDEKERDEIIKKGENLDFSNKTVTNLELLNSTYTGQLENYEFDYDEAFTRVLNNLNKTEDIDIPKNLSGTLREYQKTGFKWLYTNTVKGFGSCIADDMGLGKTIQVISLILKLKEDKKIKGQILIVCPTTLVGNWAKEFDTFAKSIKTLIYHGADRAFDNSADVIITTFAILRIDLEEFKKKKWGLIVVDEAQNIKNPDTSQAQALKSLKSTYKIAMTGTPVENRLTELWSIFDFINRGYLGSLKDFQKSYAIPIEKFKETKRAERLKLCVSPFVLRRLKTDKKIITDLPEKVVIDEYCYLTKIQTNLYEKVLQNLMGEISKSVGINRRGMIFKLITALKQICNHPFHYLKTGSINKDNSGKCAKFIDLTSNIVDNNEKAIIFTQYKEMGNILCDILKSELDIKPLFFHGSLNRNDREKMIVDFQEKDENKLMILSLKAGGTGLNLTAATNVIHYDLWWNPAVEDQATDRSYRIGQEKNVMVHRLITLGTFEEKIDEILKSKQQLANMAVFEGEKIITELTDKEIYEIFSLSA